MAVNDRFYIILKIKERSVNKVGMVLSQDEKIFSSECVGQLEVEDCSFAGPLYTWSNKHEVGYVAKKLDRVMINGEFMSKHPTAHTIFHEPRFSDHCASIIDFGQPFHMKARPLKSLIS